MPCNKAIKNVNNISDNKTISKLSNINLQDIEFKYNKQNQIKLYIKSFQQQNIKQNKNEIDYIYKKIFDKKYEYLMRPKLTYNIQEIDEDEKNQYNNNDRFIYINRKQMHNKKSTIAEANNNSLFIDKKLINNKSQNFNSFNENKEDENNKIKEKITAPRKANYTKHKYIYDKLLEINSKLFFMKSVYDYAYPKIILSRLKEEDKLYKKEYFKIKLNSIEKDVKFKDRGKFKINELVNRMEELNIDDINAKEYRKFIKLKQINDNNTKYANKLNHFINKDYYNKSSSCVNNKIFISEL